MGHLGDQNTKKVRLPLVSSVDHFCSVDIIYEHLVMARYDRCK